MAAAVVATNWPVFQGKMIDGRTAYGQVPAAWQQVAGDVDRMPAATRALVLPGQLYPFYTWGGTQDPILPSLTGRPVTARSTVPYADLRAADLLYATDDLVQQRRLVPGQLRPLLELMSVSTVVTGSDDDRARSGAAEPLGVVDDFARQRGLRRPDEVYGPLRRFGGVQGDLGRGGSLPEVRRYDLPAPRRMVRVEPAAQQTTVDGSADTLAGLAAFGALPRTGAIAYAADRSPAELRRAARAGGEVVVGDGNRRRVFTAARARQDRGATITADDPLSADAALLQPFPKGGTDSQTVTELRGARSVRAPYSPSFPQFPEHRPLAAFDGRAGTYWVADRFLNPERRYIDIDFGRPVNVDRLDLLPQRESNADVTQVEIAGKRYSVRRGWNRLRPGLGRVRSLRVRITGVVGGSAGLTVPGAIAEIRIPGVRVSDRLRTPRLAEKALAGTDLRRSALTYLFERTRGDDPYRRSRVPDPNRGDVPIDRNLDAALISDPGDGEEAIERTIDPPATRAYDLSGWVSPAPDASDAALDRLAGYRGPVRATSSARWQSRPRYRASAALDGRADTEWVAPRRSPRPWLAWATRRPRTLRSLVVTAPAGVAGPRQIALRAGARSPLRLDVPASGRVKLPRPLRARRFRIDVLRARGAPGRPVGIAEVGGRGVPTVTRPAAKRVTGPVLARVRARRRALAGHALLRHAGRLPGRPADARPRLRLAAAAAARAPGRDRALPRGAPGPAAAALTRPEARGRRGAHRARHRLRQRGPGPA